MHRTGAWQARVIQRGGQTDLFGIQQKRSSTRDNFPSPGIFYKVPITEIKSNVFKRQYQAPITLHWIAIIASRCE